MKSCVRILMVSLVALAASAAAVQAIGYCSNLCDSSAYCGQSCLDDYDQFTTCEAYGSCNPDIDSDGVPWYADNCQGTYNPGQEDCDGDGAGNLCDSSNGTFVPVSGSPRKCQIVGRTPFGYVDVRMRYNTELTDVSACGSPNRCTATDDNEHSCFSSSEWDCCVAYYGAYDCFYYLNNNTCDC